MPSESKNFTGTGNYWDEVAAAGEYLLNLPRNYRRPWYVRVTPGLKPTFETFDWVRPDSRAPLARGENDHAEWSRFRNYTQLGKPLVRHQLTVATHLDNDPGADIGVTTLHVDLRRRQIGRATFQLVAANMAHEAEEGDGLFERIRESGEADPIAVTDDDYHMLHAELLRGVTFKATGLLEMARQEWQ